MTLKYAGLFSQALALDELRGEEGLYDHCGTISLEVAGGADALETGWTKIYKFNFIMSLVLTIVWLFIAIFSPFAQYSCVCLSSAAMIATAIFTATKILGNDGAACRESASIYVTPDGDFSFADDGELMRKLWIAQIALNIPMLICGFTGISLGTASYLSYKLQKVLELDGYQ